MGTQLRRVTANASVHGLFVAFGLVIAAFFPFLALYLHDRGLSKSQIGLLISVMALARVVANPIWGHLADTVIGRLTALRIGTALTIVTALVLNRVDGFTVIAVLFAIQSVGMIATGPNLDAIALVHLGDERMSDYGHVRSWESLSYAAGCLLFGAILESAGTSWAMPLYAAASSAVLLWSLTLHRDRPIGHERHGRLGSVGAVFRAAPRFAGFLVAVLLVWIGFNAAWNFIALKIQQGGGGPLLVGVGTALGGLVEVLVMRASPRLQRRLGLRHLYAAGCATYAVGFLLWGLVEDPTIVSVLTVLEGVGFSLLFTTAIVIVGRMLPSTLYSTGNAIGAMVGFGIGPIVGAGIGGLVYDAVGAVALYVGASSLALAGAVVAWFVLDVPALARPSAAASAPSAPS
jgi:PPP family 3-phenylpropionic acid transporter